VSHPSKQLPLDSRHLHATSPWVPSISASGCPRHHRPGCPPPEPWVPTTGWGHPCPNHPSSSFWAHSHLPATSFWCFHWRAGANPPHPGHHPGHCALSLGVLQGGRASVPPTLATTLATVPHPFYPHCPRGVVGTGCLLLLPHAHPSVLHTPAALVLGTVPLFQPPLPPLSTGVHWVPAAAISCPRSSLIPPLPLGWAL
jgi:hypothetical protein